ncbi:TonB-dependent receptor [Piscinibacter sp.]|uniref:TonB-dependent receptor n=1 Tax=Piscinibacter sp. TaxID=1903157 RepID=UPI0035AEEB5B
MKRKKKPDARAAARPALLPLGALAAGFGLAFGSAHAQTAAPEDNKETTLAPIKVKAQAEATGKDSVRATETRIGKGQQELRDIPQSITVVTERLIDDRNLDTMKDALRNTAGITFQAAEGQEEDVRLRGFALQSTGDIFLDGMRDPGFYDRDSFNWDRLEVIRGSASMLFGRGSTGGAVNQVNKQPMLINQNELSMTLGNGSYVRGTADFNLKAGDDSAVRLNALVNEADNGGNRIDKQGIAPTFRWGIGTRDEFSVGLYHLQYRNGINYGFPWLQNQVSEAFKPDAYYGAASDTAAGGTTYGTATHVHRFAADSELRTVLRIARYERDQRASAIRFAAAAQQTGGVAVSPATIGAGTVLTRGSQNKIQDMESVYLQSDYSGGFEAFGMKHAVLSGIDLALDDFNRYATVTPAGVTIPAKPTTTIGTPDDGGAVDEALREVRRSQTFDAKAIGVYAQDMIEFAPMWKLLAGLRWDQFGGTYRSYATANLGGTNTTPPGTQTAERERTDSLWSRRFGLLFQPTEQQSYHLSYGTSFNTFGDAYSFDPQGTNTPPEASRNVELGGSIDWAQGRFTTRFALFHATKYNERNTDQDSVSPDNYILSGQRHAAGIDLDFAGRITPAWELFAAYEWIPSAKVDKGTLVGGEVEGSRPAMTPRHSGTFWTTYRLSPQWRVGGGLTARSGTRPYLAAFYAPSFVTGDLMAEYTAGDLSFKLNVTNVTDKLYADQLYRGHYVPGKARTVQLTTSIRF